MTRSRVSWAVIALIACAVPATPVLAQGGLLTPPGSATDQVAIDMLVADLVAAAEALPADSTVKVYEERFAQIIDRSKLDCPSLLLALLKAMALMPTPAAKAALRNLRQTLAACGTGGIGGSGFNLAPIPSFSPGGGSDYQS